MTREEIRAGLIDVNVVALTLWGECRGEPLVGQLAVASVIQNRVMHGHFGVGFKGVCFELNAFSCWWGTDANSAQLYLLGAQLLNGQHPIPPQLRWIADGVVDEAIQSDVTNGALNYLTADLFHRDPPSWAKHPTSVVEIGKQVFLKV